MRTFKSTIFSKAIGVIRFLYLKLRFGKKLSTKGLSLIGPRVRFFIGNIGTAAMGSKVVISALSEIQSQGKLTLGNKVTVNRNSRIVAFDSIVIGDHVTIAQFVTILDHDHAYTFDNDKLTLDGYKTAPVTIGDNVWIGDKVSIIKGSNIGNNVIVAAHTLVNGDVPNNCIVAGTPFKIIKRFEA